MKLMCGGNSIQLGIENQKGEWDYVKFVEHVKDCDKCKSISNKLLRLIITEGGLYNGEE